MLIIYTGEGKGKTSAAAGQALRALGQGLRVSFAQLIKNDVRAGEQIMLGQLLGENFFIGGRGFFIHEKDRAAHTDAARQVLAWAGEHAPASDLLVLDEALYALEAGLILEEELRALIEQCRRENTHLALSGRGLPEWLAQEADLVTSMTLVKHPHDTGAQGRPGIEY
ncbi:MAG: cob(I)yrinic acid a,c-diamide adenosyltransferase [Desulfovibrionaceae bacterium]|nr:cob(I)yrinic acid a,c-diamide adenosyltransferase [Desulfovibrionaceae bacterium]